MTSADTSRVCIGVSACLLGHRVRYDGREKREPCVADKLAQVVEFEPICPEVELGMGVPRESIELRLHGGERRLLGVHTQLDHTADMSRFSRSKLDELTDRRISGYVFKSRSPSCGVADVPVYDEIGQVASRGPGMFADALMHRFPDMPVVDELAIRAPCNAAHFLDRVLAYRRVAALFEGPVSVGALVAFHSREKRLLLAHDQLRYHQLERLVARAREQPSGDLLAEYRRLFMAALARPPTPESQRV